MSDQVKDIMERRDAIDMAASKVSLSWVEAATAQFDVQRQLYVDIVAQGSPFEAKDARTHILAIDRIIAVVQKQFGRVEVKRKGRPAKTAPKVIAPPDAAPMDGDERIRAFADKLCPQGWQDTILPAFQDMANGILDQFLEAPELSEQDAARAEYKELQIFIKKLYETDAAGERARFRLLKRRVA